jgi:hypothetical protein
MELIETKEEESRENFIMRLHNLCDLFQIIRNVQIQEYWMGTVYSTCGREKKHIRILVTNPTLVDEKIILN